MYSCRKKAITPSKYVQRLLPIFKAGCIFLKMVRSFQKGIQCKSLQLNGGQICNLSKLEKEYMDGGGRLSLSSRDWDKSLMDRKLCSRLTYKDLWYLPLRKYLNLFKYIPPAHETGSNFRIDFALSKSNPFHSVYRYFSFFLQLYHCQFNVIMSHQTLIKEEIESIYMSICHYICTKA